MIIALTIGLLIILASIVVIVIALWQIIDRLEKVEEKERHRKWVSKLP